jgi:hypothetical protein
MQTVKGLLSDNDIRGQMRLIVKLLESQQWKGLWDPLNLKVFQFKDLQIEVAATDNVVWETCQREGVVLVTGNRNLDGATSLEETIRTQNRPTSLPVFTIANCKKVLRNRSYADRVVEVLLGRLIDIQEYLGTGRLFLP